ncbi:MAG TPA: oxidoreductase [Terriglobales bacterium]|nr:oxidoreductase [Terriglobales bacterium]
MTEPASRIPPTIRKETHIKKVIQEIEVGLIGFGFAGRVFHAPVISTIPGLRLAAIVQRHGDSARELYPDAQLLRSVDDLLAQQSLRLIVVATPTASHFSVAHQCLLHDRDVVVDKPFVTNSSEAIDLLRLAQQRRRILSVYQNRRWDGDFLTVRRLLQEDVLGEIVLYESHYDRYRPQLRPGAWRELPEPGSGIWFDLGAHLVDQAVVLFGMPEAVSADLRIEREGAAVDDAFDVVLHYGKMRVLLRAGMLVCAPTPRFRLNGSRGSFVKFGLDPQEEALKAGLKPSPGWGLEPEEMWGTLSLAEESATTSTRIATAVGDYRRYYENVRDAVSSSAALEVASQQILDVVRLLEIASESSGRRCTLPVSGMAAPA